MALNQAPIDAEALDQLAERLERGIPQWERAAFIEVIVPALVKQLQGYIRQDYARDELAARRRKVA